MRVASLVSKGLKKLVYLTLCFRFKLRKDSIGFGASIFSVRWLFFRTDGEWLKLRKK